MKSGETFFFISKYSFNDFWHISSRCLIPIRASYLPSTEHAFKQFDSVIEIFIHSLNSESMPSNLFVSSGNCLRISTEDRKIDSSDAHDLDTVVYIWRVSSTTRKVDCQLITRSLKYSINFPIYYIPCSSIWCPSIPSTTSSAGWGT